MSGYGYTSDDYRKLTNQLLADQKEKKAMTSQIKVNVNREELIERLNARKADLEASNLHPAVEKYVTLLEEAAAEIRAGNTFFNPKNGYPCGKLAEVFDEWQDTKHALGRMDDSLIKRIDRQVGLLQLSTDATVEVGIDDDIYKLLF